MAKYMMALDAGTTSNRCILFNEKGEICSVAQQEFTQYYPQPGWVEHDAKEIWHTQLSVARQAMKQLGVGAADIAGIGITNQRETTIVWDRETGVPVYNAIVWQCRRTSEYCDSLKERGLVDMIQKKTGLVIDAYFSGSKIHWILENVPGAREKAEAGQLMFGTVDTWLIYNLSGKKIHVTDYSNAARTMLFNINTLQWDDEILEALEIPKSMLPTPKPSSEIYGMTEESLFQGRIPIAGAAGDQQSALFGQTCFNAGEAKNTYGTGTFLLMNIGKEMKLSENGMVTTVAWGLDGEVNYALEGSVFVAGAAIQWLRDEVKIVDAAPDSEFFCNKVPDTNGCYKVKTSLLGPIDSTYRSVDDICLELHQEVVLTSAAVNLEGCQFNTNVFLHSFQNIVCLICQGFNCSTDDVCFVTSTGQAYDTSTSVLIPVRSSKSCKCRNYVTSVSIRNLVTEELGIRSSVHDLNFVTQPLDSSTSYEYGTFQSVVNFAVKSPCNCGNHAVLGQFHLFTNVH